MRAAFGLTMALSALTFFPAVAHADTGCAQFEILNRNAPRSYDPFSPSPFADTFQVRVERTNRAVSSVRFLIVDATPSGALPKFGAQGPDNYQISWVQDQGRRAFTTGADSITEFNAARVGFAGTGDVSVTTFLLRIPRGQQSIAGRQYERFELRYRCYSGNAEYGGEGLQRDGLTELAINIPREVTAYVGGVGSTHGEIDFGTLSGSEALQRSVSITALSTLPYSVTIDSENGQALKRNGGRGSIPYSMTLSGQPVFDKSRLQCPVTPMPSGQTQPLAVRLDGSQVGKQPAGDYRDTITVTFQVSDGIAGDSCQLLTTRKPL